MRKGLIVLESLGTRLVDTRRFLEEAMNTV